MIVWRYLLQSYLKVFFLATISFIAILLVSRLEEIAQFIALGAPLGTAFLFILYQIPYILPIAVPISCLLSSMLLMQRLSMTSELIALRGGGFSFRALIAPLATASLLLSFTTFYISSELATNSHLNTRKMVYNLTSVNPLLLLAKARTPKLKMAYVQMDPVQQGKKAKELFIAYYNRASKRINCFLAKKVELKNQDLIAKDVTCIVTTPSPKNENDEVLMVENQSVVECGASEFAKILRHEGWKIANDHLKLRLLLIKREELENQIKEASRPGIIKELRKTISKCDTEIVRRFSLAIAPLTFTLLGISFGIQIGRKTRKKKIFYVVALGAFALISFFTAKELDHLFLIASSLFVIPHLLMTFCSLWTLRRAAIGKEG